jgi:hypothetical protein
MTSPRDDVERDALEGLIGAVAREMTRGEPPRDLLLRVRDRIDESRPARHWVWQTAAVGVLLLLVVLGGTLLRVREDRPAEPIATSLPPPRPAPTAEQRPPPPPSGLERSLERLRPTASVGAAIRTPIPALAAQSDLPSALPSAASLPSLALPEPLVVSVSPPVELEVPAEIVLTSIAVDGLSVPPLNSRKESR